MARFKKVETLLARTGYILLPKREGMYRVYRAGRLEWIEPTLKLIETSFAAKMRTGQ